MRSVRALPADGNAAIIGENLNRLLVVQLEQLRHQIADGVIAQVGGDIADAQAALRQIDRRVAAVRAQSFGGTRSPFSHVTLGRAQLQQRIVRIRRHRQRLDRPHELRALERALGGGHRPAALAQAQPRILAGGVALGRVQLQALLQGRFRGLGLLMIDQHTADLLQRHGLVLERLACDRRQALRPHLPGEHRVADRALALQHPAQVHIGG